MFSKLMQGMEGSDRGIVMPLVTAEEMSANRGKGSAWFVTIRETVVSHLTLTDGRQRRGQPGGSLLSGRADKVAIALSIEVNREV